MRNPNQLMTIGDVAFYLQVKKTTIRRWIKNENFPHIRANPCILRFIKKDILKWLQERHTFYVDTIVLDEK